MARRFRAENVGSSLAELLQARNAHAQGRVALDDGSLPFFVSFG
jgi:hypothetical protein